MLELGKYYKSAETGLNVTQSAYSDNWRGGDKGSLVWTWNFNGALESQLEPQDQLADASSSWPSARRTSSSGAPGVRGWDKPEKSTDLVDLESILRFTLGGYVDPFVSGRLESQFLDASDPHGRNLFLNPLQFKESAGIARQFVDEEERSLLSRLGFTLRQSRRSFYADVDASDGLTDVTSSDGTTDGGLELVTDYKTRILEDKVAWTAKLGFYQPLFFSGKSDLHRRRPRGRGPGRTTWQTSARRWTSTGRTSSRRRSPSTSP